MGEFRMPSLGADMAQGAVVEWKVAPGDHVERGQIVALVETEKADIDVEIWEDGVVERILVEPGVTVPVGTVLMVVAATAAAAAEPAHGTPPSPREVPEVPVPAPPPRSEPPRPVTPAPRPAVPCAGPAPAHPLVSGGWVRSSPAARAAAHAAKVELDSIAGSGPDGAVLRRDVIAARGADVEPGPRPVAAERPAADEVLRPAAPSAQVLDRALAMRRAIAAAMARSKREIPHYYLGTRVDLGAASAWLEERNRGLPPAQRLVMAPLFLKSVALALRDFGDFNGFWLEDAFHPGAGIHLGVAVALRGGGLVAPAIHDADRMSLGELMTGLADLVSRARKGGLRGSEMTDATITVTSLGDLGVETVYGIIYPPQVALVGFGTPARRPWAVDGGVVSRMGVHLTLAGDHRASDGHRGGRFLAAVAGWLAKPEAL